jgi:hypothetical protein
MLSKIDTRQLTDKAWLDKVLMPSTSLDQLLLRAATKSGSRQKRVLKSRG